MMHQRCYSGWIVESEQDIFQLKTCSSHQAAVLFFDHTHLYFPATNPAFSLPLWQSTFHVEYLHNWRQGDRSHDLLGKAFSVDIWPPSVCFPLPGSIPSSHWLLWAGGKLLKWHSASESGCNSNSRQGLVLCVLGDPVTRRWHSFNKHPSVGLLLMGLSDAWKKYL